jgi:hypothetical protein
MAIDDGSLPDADTKPLDCCTERVAMRAAGANLVKDAIATVD